MEDNGRELDPNPLNAPPVKDGSPSRKELTIMLIGSVGKMRSFKISRKLILYASIFFIIYIIFSLFIFYSYLDLYAAHKAQSINLQNLEAELSDKKKILEQNKLYIKVLEDSRKGIDDKPGIETAPKKAPEKSSAKVNVPSGKKSQKTAQKEPNEKAAATDTTRRKTPEQGSPEERVSSQVKSQETALKESKEMNADRDITQEKVPEQSGSEENVPGGTENRVSAPEEVLTDPMEVRDINFQRSGSKLILNFVLANKLADEKTAEGFIHIIVMDKNKECPSEWNNSYNELAKGFPKNFSHGQQFLIQKYRPYQRKYEANPDSELPSFIRILVYDRSGQKILEKELPVTDESTNDKS